MGDGSTFQDLSDKRGILMKSKVLEILMYRCFTILTHRLHFGQRLE